MYFPKDGSYQDTESIPTPKVIIDQDSDPDATVVEITFGDRLGALLDTVCHILLTGSSIRVYTIALVLSAYS